MEAFLAVVHNMVMLVGILYLAQLLVGVFNCPLAKTTWRIACVAF